MASHTNRGWVNIHIILPENEVVASKHPYKTKAEADTAIFIGPGTQKVGCFLVEWEEQTKEKQ